jgi:hypothetical protein
VIMCMCLGKVHDVAFRTWCKYRKNPLGNSLRYVVESFFDRMSAPFQSSTSNLHMHVCQSKFATWTLHTLLSRRAVYTHENYISPITQTKLYNFSAFALAEHNRPLSFAHLQQ